MKKFKKINKKIIIGIVLCIVFAIIFSVNSKAVKISEQPTSLKIYREIKNIDKNEEKIENVFKYKIEPSKDNPAVIQDFPTEASIKFNNVFYKSTVANADGTIDLSNFDFPTAGIYKYRISEIDSENKEKYPIDTKNSFEFFVQVSSKDGENKATLLEIGEHYINNIDQNEKMEIKFTSYAKQTINKPDNDTTDNDTVISKNIVEPRHIEEINNETTGIIESQDNDKKSNKDNTPIYKKIIRAISPKTGDIIGIYFGLIIIAIVILCILYSRKSDKKNDTKLLEEKSKNGNNNKNIGINDKEKKELNNKLDNDINRLKFGQNEKENLKSTKSSKSEKSSKTNKSNTTKKGK